MTTAPNALSGLLQDLEALEKRHREVEFAAIRALLDEEPARGWRLLVEKYSRFVWSVALQLSRGLEDPEEFAAEIYRRVFVRLEKGEFALVRRFEGKCQFRTYLYQVVRTERFRLFRRRGTEKDAYERIEAEAAAEAPPGPGTPVWAVGVGREAARRSLAELGDEDREILTLRFGAGLKLRELAEAIGARDTNDAAYRVRRALSRCAAVTQARADSDWSEDAFREAAAEFRRALFSDPVQNPSGEVSHSDEPSQEGEPG